MKDSIPRPETEPTSPELEEVRQIIATLNEDAQKLVEKHANLLRDQMAAAPAVFPFAIALVAAEISANYKDAHV